MSTDTRCVAAYNTISVNADGGIEPCCQYRSNGTSFKFTEFKQYQATIQQQMHNDANNNIRHPECNKCWTEEDHGWRTLRNHFKKWYGEIASTSVNFDNPLYDIELRLGNYCNLKCIMCQPGASSSIATERKQHKEKFARINIDSWDGPTEKFWETPEFLMFTEKLFKDARRVNITGGEPFIIPEVLNILDQLLPKKEVVNISFNSNLTRVSAKLIERLKQFKKLNICVSLEGIGPMNDYLRYPSDWSTIVSNIDLLKNQVPNAVISVNHTFQNSSVYALPDLVSFCYDNKFILQLTSVQGNELLTLNTVPAGDLEKFKSWAENSKLLTTEQRAFILNTANAATFNLEMANNFQKYTNLLDEIRGTNYQSLINNSNIRML